VDLRGLESEIDHAEGCLVGLFACLRRVRQYQVIDEVEDATGQFCRLVHVQHVAQGQKHQLHQLLMNVGRKQVCQPQHLSQLAYTSLHR